MDSRNIKDMYKGWHQDLIREDVQQNTFPYAVLMSQMMGDFNFASVVRSANFLGAKEVYYYGNRKWDRRGSVGTYHYTNVRFLSSFEDVINLKKQYSFVALENNINRNPINLKQYVWQKNSLICLGEEGKGLTEEFLDICDSFVEIVGYGSVRSLNASVAGSIAMQDYVGKYDY